VGTDRQIEVYVGQLAYVITTLARHDSVTAYQLAQRFVRDRGITWIRRASLVRGLRGDGFPEIADAALLAVAQDTGEPAHNRVAMLELKRFDNHLAHDDESLALLTAWLYDPDQPTDLRQAALDSILRDAAPAEIRRLAGDRRLHVRLRISAAFRLTRDRTEIAEARAMLRAVAAEDALPAAERMTVGFARILLRLTGWLVRAPRAARPAAKET
jgi:hypothetical protein